MLIGLGVAVSIVASCEYYRFVSMSKQGRAYTLCTALLAVVVAAILAVLGIVMALYFGFDQPMKGPPFGSRI